MIGFAAVCAVPDSIAKEKKTYPPLGLVAHWDFNEGQGNIIHDKVGWIGNFQAFGNPKWIKNTSGYCVHIDNREGEVPVYLQLPSMKPFGQLMKDGRQMLVKGTLSLWTKPVKGGFVKPFRPQRKCACLWYSTIMISSNDCWYFNKGDRSMRIVNRLCGPKAENEWTHIVGTWDEDRTRLYVNGELIRQPQGEVANNIYSHGNLKFPFRVGLTDPAKPFHHYNGLLDDIRYYSVALSPEKVRKLYQDGLEGVRVVDNEKK